MPDLKRVLGATFGLAIVVGATIGGGILHAPGDIAAVLPAAGLIMAAWVFGAVNILMGGTMYAELGAMIPRSGGTYVFAHRAFGRRAGCIVGWADWLNLSVSSAAILLLIGEYAGGLIAPLTGHPVIAGILAFTILAIVNWLGVKEGARSQEVTSVLKTLGLLVLIVGALLFPHTAIAAPAVVPVIPHGMALVLACGVALQAVVFTYDNYYIVVYCSEEIQDPGTEIPRAVFRGSALVIVIYLLINAAFLHVMPASAMGGDPFVGATLARSLFGPRGDTVIRLIMVISLLGMVNAQIITAPRVILAMARDGLFPRAALRVNEGGTPTTALVLSLALIFGFVFIGSFNAAIAIDAFFIVGLYVVVFTSFFRLRRREPDAARPWRAPGYPWLQGAALLVAFAMLIAMALGDWKSAAITAALLAISWPLSGLVKSEG